MSCFLWGCRSSSQVLKSTSNGGSPPGKKEVSSEQQRATEGARSVNDNSKKKSSSYDLESFTPMAKPSSKRKGSGGVSEDHVQALQGWRQSVQRTEPSCSTEESSESAPRSAPFSSVKQQIEQSFSPSSWIDCELELSSSGIVKTDTVSARRYQMRNNNTSATAFPADISTDGGIHHRLPPFHMAEEDYKNHSTTRGHRKVRSDSSYVSYISSASSTSTRSTAESGFGSVWDNSAESNRSHRSIRSTDDGDSPPKVNKRSASFNEDAVFSKRPPLTKGTPPRTATPDPGVFIDSRSPSPGFLSKPSKPQRSQSSSSSVTANATRGQQQHYHGRSSPRSQSPPEFLNKPSQPNRSQRTSGQAAATVTSHKRSSSLTPRLRPSRRDSPATYQHERAAVPVTPDNVSETRGRRRRSASERRRDRSRSLSSTSTRSSVYSTTRNVGAYPRRSTQRTTKSNESTAKVAQTTSAQPTERKSTRNEQQQRSRQQQALPAWTDSFSQFPFGQEDTDRLSEIPSDVPDDVKQRYLTACRLLKQALIENDSTLQASEKQFLAKLLLPDEQLKSATEDKISVIESATGSLHFDPLFTDQTNETVSQLTMETRSGHTTTTGSDVLLAAYQASSPLRHTKQNNFSFSVLGADNLHDTVLSPVIMEALQGFLPTQVHDSANFLLKFSLERDGSSMETLLANVRSSRHTLFAIETKQGHVFGAFCSTPWRARTSWYGSGDSFLWKLRKSRQEIECDMDENEIELYPNTGADGMVQYCTDVALAVGGGTDWSRLTDGCPYEGMESGIGLLLDGDLLGGETNSCVTFANPRLIDSAASSEFEIRALEVWTVTSCLTVEEAEQEELSEMFQGKFLAHC